MKETLWTRVLYTHKYLSLIDYNMQEPGCVVQDWILLNFHIRFFFSGCFLDILSLYIKMKLP